MSKSHVYACPYPSDYLDIHLNFPGCTANTDVTAPVFLPFPPPTSSYSYDFTTVKASAAAKPFKYPIYSLGGITSGKTIGIKLALVDIDNNAAPVSSFTIKLIKGTPEGTAVDLSSQCSGASSACSVPCLINATDDYYLAVYDATGIFVKSFVQWFALEVIDDINAAAPSTLLKVSDVLRDRVIKYLYIDPAQATTLTLSPVVSDDTANRDLELFAVSGSGNVFQVGAQQTIASASVGGSVQRYTTD